MRPIVMPPNRLDHFYLGGSRITDLRGVPATSERSPEEWLASTVTRFGEERTGLSSLPDGTLFRDAVEADPDAWLGIEHEDAFARPTALQVVDRTAWSADELEECLVRRAGEPRSADELPAVLPPGGVTAIVCRPGTDGPRKAA